MTLPSLLMDLQTLSIGAPSKRKARDSHYGLSTDSRSTLALVIISRLAQIRDEALLEPAAASPVGATFLAFLRAAMVRLALIAGADASFNDQSIATLLNMSASNIAA